MSARPTLIEQRRGARRCAACCLFLILYLAATGNLRASSTAEEYSIKAAFLFHFAQFVEWPEGAFRKADSPLVYCTIGEDPFQGLLDATLKDKTIGAHAFQIRHLKQIQDAEGCHLVFVGEGEKKQILAALAVLKGSPILTVGESERFVQEGGIIAFCLEENKIRFEINLEAAEKANLKISSRLLALAKTVIGKPKRD
jgi:YfiR/HmsC-like